MSIDLLVVGAHPDDAELGAGGTLALLAQRGFRTAILDLTRGELGTRGTPDERAQEAQEAAKILGVYYRANAELPDGAVANTEEQRRVVVAHLLEMEPKILIVPMSPDRHPDHAAAHQLLKDASFLYGLRKYPSPSTAAPELMAALQRRGVPSFERERLLEGIPSHAPIQRAKQLLTYHAYADQETQPAIVQDISSTFEAKIAALRSYKSQFHNPEYPGAETLVSSPAFWEGIAIRAAYWGQRIGVNYGEPFYAQGPFAFDIGRHWLANP